MLPAAANFLVVDDESIFHFLITKMLTRLGFAEHSIQTASSGKEALDLIVRAQLTGTAMPEFILLDLNMPIMGGFAFLEACRMLPQPVIGTVRVAIVSSSLDKRDYDRAMELGVNHYLVKPVTEEDLRLMLTHKPE